MRKEYCQALRKRFEMDLLAALPGWEQLKLQSIYLFPGERPFRRIASPDMHLWCLLVPHQKTDQFTVEIGWSRRARFPELSMRPSADDPEAGLMRDEYICRLGRLSHGHDHWWTMEPLRLPTSSSEMVHAIDRIPAAQADARVAPVVEDAVEALKHYGEPYLARAIAQRR